MDTKKKYLFATGLALGLGGICYFTLNRNRVKKYLGPFIQQELESNDETLLLKEKIPVLKQEIISEITQNILQIPYKSGQQKPKPKTKKPAPVPCG